MLTPRTRVIFDWNGLSESRMRPQPQPLPFHQSSITVPLGVQKKTSRLGYWADAALEGRMRKKGREKAASAPPLRNRRRSKWRAFIGSSLPPPPPGGIERHR